MASPTAVVSGSEAAQSTQLDSLYAMPELAQICHFCLTFQAPLKLPSFSRTDLQATLIAGTTGDDRQVSLLAELHFKLVREQGAKLERMIQDWEKAVVRKVTDNWRLEFSSNPFDGAMYDDLSVAQRIQILNALCHWKLESCAEIHKYLAALQKGSDAKALDALRATPIGYDDTGAAYWYFGDRCWVYAEDRPAWQSQALHEYTVEFADAKRIRLSINFAPTGSVASRITAIDQEKVEANGVKTTDKPVRSELQISTLVDEEIDEDEEDEPLPTAKQEQEDENASVLISGRAVEPQKDVVDEPPVKTESAKMNIDMLCSSTLSSPSTDAQLKPEPMEEDEHDVSEDRFMSTIVSKRDPSHEQVTPPEPTRILAIETTTLESSKPVVVVTTREEENAKQSPTKKRVHEDGKGDVKPPALEPVQEVAPKRRKTRFHDITWATDNTTGTLVDKVEPVVMAASPTPIEKEPTAIVAVVSETQPTDADGSAEDFEILCAACQRSYDRRYLDPPLDKRPMGEWRCFECLVNDARGWPRRRPSSAKSPKAADGKEHGGDEKASAAKRKSPSSSSSKSKGKSGSSSKSHSKKSSSSRSSSSSSKHKKSSSSSNSSKRSSKKKKSSSSSSSKHSSSRHHRHHREEYANLLKLAHSRKRERLAIEEARLDGTHLCPVPLDGPSNWRVVCSSVEGLRQVTEQLVGGSLEQDRLRGRLIMILKVEEKHELERLKKHEQQLWQVLPRRQSSRVAMGRMRSQNNSDESSADHSGGEDRTPSAERRSSRSSRTRSEGPARLALDRESRAQRRRRDDASGSESESDAGKDDEPSVEGWIRWSSVKGENSLAMVCAGAVNRLLKEEIAELFARPVDPVEDGCPDYLTVITQPMDLGTIRQRVDEGFYTTWELFKRDVDRVWSNCRKYNSPDMAVVEYADTLDQMFTLMRKEAERNGVRKMARGDARLNGKQLSTVGSNNRDAHDDQVEDDDEDDDDAAKSSGDESVSKAKSDSSASEVSSVESDDSSDASSGHSNAGARAAATPRKTRQAATSRPSRSVSFKKPARSSRSVAPSPRGKSSRRRKAQASDSEEEEEEVVESHSDSEEEDADSDDSHDTKRKRSRKPTPPRRSRLSSTRSDNRPTTGGKQPLSAGPPASEASVEASAGESSKRGAPRTNRIVSSDSSSSDESMKRDSSSSSSEEDSDAESNGGPPSRRPPPAEPRSTALAPPPPASPPPPTSPVPGSAARVTPTPPARGPRKAKPVVSRPPPPPAGSDSSSSYFSSSDSDSSGDSSDSDSD